MINENEYMVSTFNLDLIFWYLPFRFQFSNASSSGLILLKLFRWSTSLTRSARSYLVHQPGFDLVELNKTRSSTLIFLLKNGNNLSNRPISVPGSER